MNDIKTTLEDALKSQGVEVAVLVGRDGFVIEAAASSASKDIEATGAMVSTGMGSAESVGSQLGLRRMQQAMMEYDGGIIVMGAVGNDGILAIEANRSANLGAIRLAVKKTTEALSHLL